MSKILILSAAAMVVTLGPMRSSSCVNLNVYVTPPGSVEVSGAAKPRLLPGGPPDTAVAPAEKRTASAQSDELVSCSA